MKLLKPIFIIAMFFEFATIAYSRPNNVDLQSISIVGDTIKHNPSTHKLPPPPTRAENIKQLGYNDCIFVNRYSIVQRLKQYPFSKAVKILVVSYYCCPPNEEITFGDTIKKIKTPVKFTDSVFTTGLNVSHGELNYSSLKEVKQLDKQQINNLTNIIYNTTYKRKNMIADPGANCFNDRNAFVFFDKNGKIFDFLEVCFECDRIESLSGNIGFRSGCNQQLDYLKKFLIDAGIKYGTLDTNQPALVHHSSPPTSH